jgi:hypothetical protein
MGITYPVDAIDNTIVQLKVFGIGCKFTADFAVMPILECGHPILAIVNYLAHFRRLNLM